MQCGLCKYVDARGGLAAWSVVLHGNYFKSHFCQCKVAIHLMF